MSFLSRGPDWHLPQGVAARVADAVDHLAKALLDLRTRDAGVLHQRLGVAVAPRLPDAGERLALDAEGIHHYVVDGDVAQAELRQHRVHLSPDVQIAADRRAVEVGDALPEAVGVEPRRVAPEHPVVLGNEVQPAAGPGDAHHLLDRAAGVGYRLQHVPAHAP